MSVIDLVRIFRESLLNDGVIDSFETKHLKSEATKDEWKTLGPFVDMMCDGNISDQEINQKLNSIFNNELGETLADVLVRYHTSAAKLARLYPRRDIPRTESLGRYGLFAKQEVLDSFLERFGLAAKSTADDQFEILQRREVEGRRVLPFYVRYSDLDPSYENRGFSITDDQFSLRFNNRIEITVDIQDFKISFVLDEKSFDVELDEFEADNFIQLLGYLYHSQGVEVKGRREILRFAEKLESLDRFKSILDSPLCSREERELGNELRRFVTQRFKSVRTGELSKSPTEDEIPHESAPQLIELRNGLMLKVYGNPQEGHYRDDLPEWLDIFSNEELRLLAENGRIVFYSGEDVDYLTRQFMNTNYPHDSAWPDHKNVLSRGLFDSDTNTIFIFGEITSDVLIHEINHFIDGMLLEELGKRSGIEKYFKDNVEDFKLSERGGNRYMGVSASEFFAEFMVAARQWRDGGHFHGIKGFDTTPLTTKEMMSCYPGMFLLSLIYLQTGDVRVFTQMGFEYVQEFVDAHGGLTENLVELWLDQSDNHLLEIVERDFKDGFDQYYKRVSIGLDNYYRNYNLDDSGAGYWFVSLLKSGSMKGLDYHHLAVMLSRWVNGDSDRESFVEEAYHMIIDEKKESDWWPHSEREQLENARMVLEEYF